MTTTKVLSIAVISLLFSFEAEADNIRGRMIETTEVGSGSAASGVFAMKLEDTWGITFADDRDLLRGVEILIDLPDEARAFPGTYAVFVYGGVRPVPEKDKLSYTGNLLFFKAILGGRKLFVQIPLGSSAGFAPVADTFIAPKPLQASSLPLVFTFLPVMKGLPAGAAAAVFKVQVRPIFKNLGKMLFRLSDGAAPIPLEKGNLTINEKSQPLAPEGIIVEPGIYRVKIEVEGFGPFLSTVGIDRGKVSLVMGTFRKNDTLIKINAPAGSRVFLDGNSIEIEKKEINLDPGEHILTFKVGDYQLSKKFKLEEGKSYTISLFLDILINED